MLCMNTMFSLACYQFLLSCAAVTSCFDIPAVQCLLRLGAALACGAAAAEGHERAWSGLERAAGVHRLPFCADLLHNIRGVSGR